MPTVSPTIPRLLDRLRRRERWLAMSWAASRFFTGFAGLFLLGCALDWWIDRRQDTPQGLRLALFWGQIGLWLLLPLYWALRYLRWPSDDEVALDLERAVPSLGHRLISAVQLNRPGAKIAGMSPDLIAAVTAQAQQQAATVDLTQVSDGRRYRWAGLLGAGVLTCLVGLYAAMPQTSSVLLRRWLGAEVPIPRDVQLTTLGPQVWPAHEENLLRLRAEGHSRQTDIGELLVLPDEGDPFRVELHHEEGNFWAAKLPPMDTPFRYLAWLRDGRLHTPGRVSYSPRPVVQSVQATVLLPMSLLGQTASGQPYEEAQRGGDIDYRLPGSSARITIQTQVPIVFGELRIDGSRLRSVPLTLAPDGLTGTATVPLLPDDRLYEVRVRDRFNFENNDPPRRVIRRLPLEPPEVVLLPETFYREGDEGSPEDREVEGIPILLGERFALAYAARARYGLSHVQLRFRVIPRSAKLDAESGGEIDRDAFLRLPLGPPRNAKSPPSAKLREEFSTRPVEGDALPDTEGGGRYDFLTTGISDGKGGRIDLKEGDRVQFYVEAFSKADPDGVSGRSEVREKEVVDLKTYLAWLQRKEDLKERTRLLEEQQRAARPGNLEP